MIHILISPSEIFWSIIIISLFYYLVYRWAKQSTRDIEKRMNAYPKPGKTKISSEVNRLLEPEWDDTDKIYHP